MRDSIVKIISRCLCCCFWVGAIHCARAQTFPSPSQLLNRNIQWDLIELGQSNGEWYFDSKLSQDDENFVSTFLMTLNRQKKERTGPYPFKVNCVTRESYWLPVDDSGQSEKSARWSKAPDNSVFANIVQKLCSTSVQSANGMAYRFMKNVSREFDQYWSPGSVRLKENGKKVFLVPVLNGLNMQPLVPFKTTITIYHSVLEVDCEKSRMRASKGGSFENVSAPDESNAWIERQKILEPIFLRICENPFLSAQAPMVEGATILPTLSGQQSVAPVPVVAPLITDRLSLDASKVKCGELGFKSGTEAFGKCVLQLSK